MEQLSRNSYSTDDEEQYKVENEAIQELEEEEEENELTPASAMARSLTVRPKVFGPVPPEPKVSLVTKVKSPQAQQQQQQKMPWSDFMFKARLAYDIFFPPKVRKGMIYTPHY